jgi:hypothetical protein
MFILNQTLLDSTIYLKKHYSFTTYELHILKVFFVMNLKHKFYVMGQYNFFLKLMVKDTNV